ncbi:MAG: PD-(D/E)XK nuclease family protein [Oscillospiraceae bacterium]|nr:PD-(D/E)XK nuclease family protein [Oscillospiraceae bacterium]
MTLSASRAESYHRCPFQYFCRFGLQAKPRKEADFDPLFRGSAVHSVLEHLLRDQGVDALLALAPPERRRLLDEEMDRYAAEFLRGENLPERVRYLFRRLREILAQVLERLLAEFASSAFRPAAFELVIDRDRPVQPYVIPLEDGGELRMRGVVDRVDCAVVAGVPYFRVVDYKSGGKTFDLSEVYDGLNLQMLIYLFSLWESGAPPAADALPAGILYVPTKDPVLRQSGRDEDPEKLAAEKRKENRAGGLLLEDEGVLCAMEADARGIYLPAHRKSGGALAGPLVTLGQLGRLKRKADGILADMARNLRRGAVPALPYQKGQHSACESCDFAAACGRETGEPARWAKEMKFEDAKQLLEEEADDA